MPKAKKTDTVQAEPFVLKHRVAGAATLLFFGALVLPWVLGPPSDATQTVPVAEQEITTAEVSSREIENELLDEMEASAPVEEEVYISKITPFDAEADNLKESSLPEATQPDNTPAKQTSQQAQTLASRTAESERIAKRNAEQEAAAKRKAKALSESEEKKRSATTLAAQRQTKIEADLAAALSAESAPTASSSTRSNSKATQAVLRPVVEIERGYVVQVGVYVNKQGADRVVKDLRSKGFSPSTTVVDTNRGKKTATRVWLGPYAQRVDAGKAKSRFAELTGQGSLIREYP